MGKERKAPSLLSLCLEAIAAALTNLHLQGSSYSSDNYYYYCDYDVEQVAESLPWELLDRLARSLPPMALQSLHEACFGTSAGGLSSNRCGRKRPRCENFNTAWQVLFKLRWPLDANINNKTIKPLISDGNTKQGNLVTIDWQQQYWEKHLQECLDEAAEAALLPSFHGSLSKLRISDRIMNSVHDAENMSHDCSRLSYHGSRFGCYARCLRLQNVLCTTEICGLLQHGKLEKLMFVRIISNPEVDGVCLLLSYHAKTLLSLEFIHCQLYPSAMDKICSSICQKGHLNHGIQQFSIKSSRISESKSVTIPAGLLNFLSSAKSLHVLSLNDAKMQPSFARMIVHTLLESSSGLQTLEISENNIAGWLCTVDKKSARFSSAPESNLSLNLLTVLNLRGNNLHKGDVEDLCKILVKMPNLNSLDISDNPITDEGIRLLIPLFARAVQKENPLLELRVENCELSGIGVTKLVECLTSVKKPLNMLSIADNHLGSSVAAALAKFLGSHVRELNIEDIGLGALGFEILEKALPREVALSHINISKNRGGIRTAYFVSRLILQAPSLVSVNAGANLLPPESFDIICNALKQMRCKLERVDLTGNMHLSGANCLEFRSGGQPIIVVPWQPATSIPYDDDP